MKKITYLSQKKNFSENYDEVPSPFHLREYLSEDEMSLINSLKNLSRDIYSNTALAKEFDKKPDEVLRRYGISGIEANNWSTEIQMMRALADDDIVSAINRRDFKGYIETLNEKGILKDYQLRQIHKTSSALSEKLRSLSTKPNMPDKDLKDELVFGAFAVAVIYVVAATIAAVEVAGVFHFVVKTKFAGLEKEVRKESMDLTVNAAVNLFLDKTGTIGTIDERVVELLRQTEQLSDNEVNEVRDVVNILYRASDNR